MQFRAWLENIEVPPHMPEAFWEESLKKARELESRFISTDEMSRLERWLRDEEGWESRLDYDAGFVHRILNNSGYRESLSERIESLLEVLKADLSLGQVKRELGRLDFYKDDLFVARHKDYVSAYTNFFRTKKRSPHVDSEADPNEMSEEGREKVARLTSVYHALMDYVKLIKKVSRKARAVMDVMDRGHASWYEKKQGRVPSGPTDIMSREDLRDAEILYHATPFMREILAQGYKSKEELGGRNMLGGATDGGISFTADIEIAREIARCLREVIMIAKGQMRMQDVIKMVKGDRNHARPSSDGGMWPLKDFIAGAKDNARKKAFAREHPELAEKGFGGRREATDLYSPNEVFQMYRRYLGYTKRRYDPLFFMTDIDSFKGLDISNVGVLASKVDMAKAIKYLQSMEEYRIPTSAVLQTWRVKG